MSIPHSASSNRPLVSRGNTNPLYNNPQNSFARDISNISTKDIKFKKVLTKDTDVGEQTVYRVDIENETLLRTSNRSELASKNQCLTRRWQPALISTIVLLALAGGIGK
jgi:hypothetical protein